MTTAFDALFPNPEPIRFAVWSDHALAAEELQARLRSLGQPAAVMADDSDETADCLVVVTQRLHLSQEELATWARLANRATVDIAAHPFTDRRHIGETLPSGTTLWWSGEFRDLDRIARTVVDQVRPASSHLVSMPTLFPVSADFPGMEPAGSREDLVEQLAEDGPRVIPVRREFFDELSTAKIAFSRQDYDLIRLVRWNVSQHSRAFVNLRIGIPNELSIPLAVPRSLDDVVHDPLTSRLILLLGEAGSGKTLQLRYFDAHSALRSLRSPHDVWRSNSFYVALAEQPTEPQITVDWLAERWSAAVDTRRWCGFDRFLEDGGTLLLDGLNEGGMRPLPLDQWMLRWRDVVNQVFERGVVRVVITCRTRDQLIPLKGPRGEEPTAVTMLPLLNREIVAIATQYDPQAAQRLGDAIHDDASLADLYSSPFRLRAYLESGAAGVATTGARLFGLAISAAILRERDQLNFHDRLIPERAAAGLAAIKDAPDADPWPILAEIPLIRSVGGLAKALSFPSRPADRGRLTVRRDEAHRLLNTALAASGHHGVDPNQAIDTAIDLHILVEERSTIRFAHPTLHHLFAAFGCTTEDIAGLAEKEKRQHAPDYDEIFHFAAQLRGVEVPERIAHVDPVLAANVYAAARSAAESPASDVIVDALRSALDKAVGHGDRSNVLSALGKMGWDLSRPHGEMVGATAVVSAGEWRLGMPAGGIWSAAGRDVASERRTIELAEFRIARFPVSNAEFADFVEDGGYDRKALWTPEGWEWRVRSRTVEQFVADWSRRRDILRRHPERIVELLRSGRTTPAGAAALVRFTGLLDSEMAEHARMQLARPVTSPRYWHESTLTNPLQPVVGVSWFEANAYCEWLSGRLGVAVRLAGESEWEAACLWSLGVRDTLDVAGIVDATPGNTVELGYPTTTPISAFATRRQVDENLPVDMLGNVFEWVFDHYAPGDHSRRILKGGSWRHDAWRAHPAYRGRGDVDAQNDDIGFRYVIDEAGT